MTIIPTHKYLNPQTGVTNPAQNKREDYEGLTGERVEDFSNETLFFG